MPIYTFLDLIAIPLAIIHFGVPLAYYWYAKKKWLPKPWNLIALYDHQGIATIDYTQTLSNA